ncbi:MAG: hypothetical protein QXL16_01745 [Candidatus Micrarchaeaceae archaeon]
MNFLVSFPLGELLARSIGKKDSENSVSIFSRKKEGDIFTLLAPSDPEAKFYATAESIELGQVIVIPTDKVDSLLGEAIIGAALEEKPVIFTDENEIGMLISSGVLKNYKICKKEEILENVKTFARTEKGGSTKVVIDRAFKITGIGTVALGFVTKGKLSKHDILYHPSGKEISVKSIQVYDEDFDSVEEGSRIGISLKGAEPEELERGTLLSFNHVPFKKSFNAEVKMSEFSKEEINKDRQYLIVKGLFKSNCRIEKQGDAFEILCEKPIQIEEGEGFLLLRERKPRIFASGYAI